MVLHRERRELLVADALDRAVVEVDMRHLQAARKRFGDDGEVVVLPRRPRWRPRVKL